ncbi:MAG: DNA repair protein RecO [Burkholderiaceae bacterium]
MKRERIQDQPAFLLHAIPYGETSLVLDLLTRDHGRIAALAKGAKRPRSALRAVLLQFQPLRVSYSGKAELRTLTAAEWSGGLASPRGDALLCAFYMNELMLKLLAREDSHPGLFAAYEQALHALSENQALDDTLRRFEWHLLGKPVMRPIWCVMQSNDRSLPGSRYAWLPEGGFVVCDVDQGGVSGEVLLSIASHDYLSESSRQQAKALTRRILNHCLGGQDLNTRRILRDLQRR